MCTVAMNLASTGILDGKKCSVHWNSADRLRKLFPRVSVQPDRLITDEYCIYTNGGGYSFLNLVIYLIEKFYDREDRKSTRLNSITNAHLVCRLLLEKKKHNP